MKQQPMLTRLKSGLKSRQTQVFLVITVILIVLNVLQSCSTKKEFAELHLKKNELLQCQSTNEDNQSNINELELELNHCVGTKQLIKNKLTIAEVNLQYFSETREENLNDRIETLQNLPPQNCDHVVVDSNVVSLWLEKADSQN